MCLCDRFLTGPDCLEVDKAVRVKVLRAGAQQTLTLKVGRMPGEHTQILAALEQIGWRIRGVDGAAKLLGLKPTTLESRIKKLGLERPR